VFAGDGLAWLLSSDGGNLASLPRELQLVAGALSVDLVFLDPPFGGPNYVARGDSELWLELTSIAPLRVEPMSTGAPATSAIRVAKNDSFVSMDEQSSRKEQCSTISLTDACMRLATRTRVLLLKVPKSYNIIRLARALTAASAPAVEQLAACAQYQWDLRPLCFSLVFGSVQMVLILFPTPAAAAVPAATAASAISAAAGDSPLSDHGAGCGGMPLRHAHLDRLIASIQQFDARYHGETKPRFFDWEKDRFIALHRWLGASRSRASRNCVHAAESSSP
jgi:hypothetical protein